ncbi:MAG: glycosyltransferase [Clostridiales bacterium]|jgi:cellulose synthase/poly-beta-1,6-N-acetylglucosamine synthase-like glycosyltransferase|nr:glycosyltransferase [Clostridiales bacterium]
MDRIFYDVTAAAVLLCGLALLFYAPRLYAWLFAATRQEKLVAVKNRKLAIVIPARNEIKAIPLLLDSIGRQTYPRADFDFFVIVKDPADPVIALAEAAGGTAYALAAQTCKGDALDYCLKRILADKPGAYDGFMIVDADCVLDDRCMEEMNNALESGRDIVQAKKIVKNYYYDKKKTWSLSGGCNGVIWTIIDELGNRFKSDRNITNMTIGTGIMLSGALVKKLGGWPYRATLTEDIELMYDCVIHDYTTFYYSHAQIYVEEAVKHSSTNKRRNRWLNGIINSLRLYRRKLWGLPKTKRNLANMYYSVALEPAFVYVGGLAAYALFSAVYALKTLIFHGDKLWFTYLIFSLSALGVMYLSFFVMTAWCLWVDRKYYKAISFWKRLAIAFVHPLFYAEYVWIIGKHLLIRKPAAWKVIERANFSERVAERPAGDK